MVRENEGSAPQVGVSSYVAVYLTQQIAGISANNLHHNERAWFGD